MILNKTLRNYVLACSVLISGASAAVCQDGVAPPAPQTNIQPAPGSFGSQPATTYVIDGAGPNPFFAGPANSTFLTGNHGFDGFIGFLGNPVQSIDPRAVTEFFPIFGSSWASGNSPLLPNGNAQVYGAGLTVALSDRLSFGFTQGGYAVINISSDRERALAKLGLPIPDRDIGGQREGWLNLGGFLQYTLIADVPDQFILTAGLRWEAPSGAEQVFQGGSNPAYLAPYLTAGQAFGCWHVLGTTGYEFPTGQGTATTEHSISICTSTARSAGSIHWSNSTAPTTRPRST